MPVAEKNPVPRSLLAAAAALCLAAASPLALAGPYSSLIVFGDSLSDDGNNAAFHFIDPGQMVTGNSYVPSAAYASGVYSNGSVWATDLAATLGVSLAPSALGGTDFAFGGATTGVPGAGPGGFPFDLLDQTAMYLGATHNVASPDALYVVAGGGNDARAALGQIAIGADFASTVAATALAFATHIGTIVDELQSAGARHIVVWNTPNLGLAPAVAAGGASFLGSVLASSMNGALASRLAGVSGVSTFDIFGLGTAISLAPSAYGLTNVTDACGAVAGANCDQYAYWDGIHPTAAAHRIIAAGVDSVAVPVPEPETWGLIVAGLAFVGWRSKSRRAAHA